MLCFIYGNPGKDAWLQQISFHVPASLHPLELPLIELHRFSGWTKAVQTSLISEGPGIRMRTGAIMRGKWNRSGAWGKGLGLDKAGSHNVAMWRRLWVILKFCLKAGIFLSTEVCLKFGQSWKRANFGGVWSADVGRLGPGWKSEH